MSFETPTLSSAHGPNSQPANAPRCEPVVGSGESPHPTAAPHAAPAVPCSSNPSHPDKKALHDPAQPGPINPAGSHPKAADAGSHPHTGLFAPAHPAGPASACSDASSHPSKEESADFLDQDRVVEEVVTLCNAFGPSGYEEEVAHYIEQALPFCRSFRDAIGNVYLIPKSMKESWILLDAHMDEVGYMIQSIEANGTLRFLPLGGLNPMEVYGQQVWIETVNHRRIPAICKTIPSHYAQNTQPDFASLHLDAGFCSRQEALDAGVQPGCFAVPMTKTSFQPETGVFMGKAFDDRIGCAAMLETLRALEQRQALTYTMAAATVQEEVGERGAAALMREITRMDLKGDLSWPKAAICFEGCPADDTFEAPEHVQSAMKSGPMIRARDRSMITHPGYLAFAQSIAEKHHLPLQIAVRTGGGTNGGIYHQYNIPTIVIGIPVRYAHASAGFCAWQDVTDAVQLAVEIVCALNASFDAQHKEENNG